MHKKITEHSERKGMGTMHKKITEHRVYIELMSFLAKAFLVLTLFFPAYYSSFDRHMYFMGLHWPYVILVLLMAMLFLKNCTKKWSNKRYVVPGLLLLAGYVLLSLYVNRVYHHWMWEEIHNTVSFLFAGMFMAYPHMTEDFEFDLEKFLIHCIVLSVFCSLVFGCMGYERFYVCNHEITPVVLSKRYGESRMSWIYYHKSQYSMMLIVFMGFLYRYRNKFRTMVHFVTAQVILAAALWMTHSWTAVLMAALLWAGVALDKIYEKKLWKNSKLWIATIPLLGAGCVLLGRLYSLIMAERDVSTLGMRLPIWKASIAYISSHPWGVGKQFGDKILEVFPGFSTNNCHNVFLNAMYRFSVPVGGLFVLMLLGILLFAFMRKKSFFAAGYLLAIIAVMTIDYALQSNGTALFFLLVLLTLREEKADITIQKVG